MFDSIGELKTTRITFRYSF